MVSNFFMAVASPNQGSFLRRHRAAAGHDIVELWSCLELGDDPGAVAGHHVLNGRLVAGVFVADNRGPARLSTSPKERRATSGNSPCFT